MRVGIVDYGAGNLESVRKAFEALGEEPRLLVEPDDVLAADRLVLPGVGAAGEALARLRADGLQEALDEAVRRRGRPFLGICLGMQMLAERLHEFGEHAGLGWIPGSVVALRDRVPEPLRVPHMGWNEIGVAPAAEPLFAGVGRRRRFYFAHSFAFQPDRADAVAATTDYGTQVVAAVLWENVFATQFHPEKSQLVGERLLAAFLDWSP